MSKRLFWIATVMLAVGSHAYAQQYTRVSVASGGTQGNGASKGAVITVDGKIVAFTSAATNLVSGDTNASDDVFLRDISGNTTTRVSVANDGNERTGASGFNAAPGGSTHFLIGPNVSVNLDASVVAFSSLAQFDAADTNTTSDIYVRNRTQNLTSLISVSSNNTLANGPSGDPQISGNGRYVIFTSTASNLVTGDNNGVEDVFLRDRTNQTTTRLSVSSSGGDLSAASYGGRISANGSIVAFISEAPLVSTTDPVACPPGAATCGRAYILNRLSGEITRIDVPKVALSQGLTVTAVDLTPDGRFIAINAMSVRTSPSTSQSSTLAVYDRNTGRLDQDASVLGQTLGVSINSTGRVSAMGSGSSTVNPVQAVAVDRLLFSSVPVPADAASPSFPVMRFTLDGLEFVFNTPLSHGADDTNGFEDVYLGSYDADADGMPDYWETQFGLNPADGTDAALDADADGVTNLQEWQNGTHPKGTFKRYFAEGAANSFFKTRFGVFNPGAQPANVLFEYLGSNGQTRTQEVTLPALMQVVINLDDTTPDQPDNDFSTVVESDQPVVVDRTMSWDKTGYGSHGETAIEAPSTTWYMAEGSTGGAFDLFYLIENPGNVDAVVTVNYLRPAPATPLVRIYPVGARSRRTIYVDTEDPLLAATDLSAKITSDQPILAERAMYFSTPTQPFAAGHEGAAVTAPSTSWFFAEGATGTFFDEFLLLANAETTDANVQITYLLPSGPPIVKTYTVPAQSRVTINVDFEDPLLKDTPVSAIVESKNAVPVVAERAMWWPSPNWYEAHLSAGATTTGTRWALADGQVDAASETYILLANTSSTPGTADVTVYYTAAGQRTTTSETKTFTLAPNSRTNVQVGVEFPNIATRGATGFATIIQSSGPPIVVERAVYTTNNNQTWAAGTDALATKLQ